MVRIVPLAVDGYTCVGIEVALPKTTLVIITTDRGYIMCGALDVALLNERLGDRGIVAGRAVGVRTFEELLDARLESVTLKARELGVDVGMKGREAILRML